MIKIVLRANGPYVTMEGIEGCAFDDSATEEDFSDAAWDFAVANAETYGYYITEDEDDMGDESSITGDQIDGWWEYFDADKHEMLGITEESFNV